MRRLILLLLLALSGNFVLTACQNVFSQQANKQANNSNSANTPIAQNTPEEAKRISLADAKTAYDKGNAVFVDTRDADSFAQEHIKGALNIPLAQFDERYKELSPDKQIIAYCS